MAPSTHTYPVGSSDPLLNEIHAAAAAVADATARLGMRAAFDVAGAPLQTGYVVRQDDDGTWWGYDRTSDTWAQFGGSDVFGAGTEYYVPMWAAGSTDTLTNSPVYFDGNNLIFPAEAQIHADQMFNYDGSKRAVWFSPYADVLTFGYQTPLTIQNLNATPGLGGIQVLATESLILNVDDGVQFLVVEPPGVSNGLAWRVTSNIASVDTEYLQCWAYDTGTPGQEIGLHFLNGAMLYMGGNDVDMGNGDIVDGGGIACDSLTASGLTAGRVPYVGTAGLLQDISTLVFTGSCFGINTSAPLRALDINDASGNCLRLIYNDADGSPTYYADFQVSAAGNLTITPSGGTATLVGQKASFGCTIGANGVGVPGTGSYGFIVIPYACTITDWYIIGDVSGSAVVDLKTGGASIIGAGNKPTLSAAQRANAAVAAWTDATVDANQEIEFNLNSVGTLEQINLILKVTKT